QLLELFAVRDLGVDRDHPQRHHGHRRDLPALGEGGVEFFQRDVLDRLLQSLGGRVEPAAGHPAVDVPAAAAAARPHHHPPPRTRAAGAHPARTHPTRAYSARTHAAGADAAGADAAGTHSAGAHPELVHLALLLLPGLPLLVRGLGPAGERLAELLQHLL